MGEAVIAHYDALIARISARSRDHLGVLPGQRLWAQIKSVTLLR
ncbi:MAG: TOBE domain-containing protein [Rhodanobacteraceae bacterium]|nr:TOBE domain-containing protein [Rhodanobacteraceae bacterium]